MRVSSKVAKKKLNRFLSLDELARLDKALTVVSQQGNLEACCCQVLKLVLLTGCRISEVTGLQWSFVKGREWHLPDSKTGAKVVYVGKEAQKLLSDIPKQAWTQRSESHDDVFMPLRRFVSRSTKVSMVWQQVRALAHIEDVRIHDLRHTFASYAVLEGFPIPMVSKLSGHTRISSTLRYAHVDDVQVSQSAEAIGEVISGILSGQLVNNPKTRKVRASKSKPTKSPPKRRGRPIKVIPELTEKEVERFRYEVDFWEW
ncbi:MULTISPECIES: site-specific integrase [Vibrio]|nr:site-specific integrase [Vibrio tasmaniensis]